MKLLVLLLGMLVLAPLLEQFFHLLLLEDLFLTAVFIYAAYSISRNRLFLVTAIGLAVPAIASTWLRPFVKAQWFGIFGGLCDVAFIAAITVTILVYTFRQKDISADVLAGAIVAYLLMAVMWSQIYVVLETSQPGSFVPPLPRFEFWLVENERDHRTGDEVPFVRQVDGQHGLEVENVLLAGPFRGVPLQVVAVELEV